jgi:hypothetical protein
MGCVTKDCDRRLSSLGAPSCTCFIGPTLHLRLTAMVLQYKTIDKLFDRLYILSVSRLNLYLQIRYRRTHRPMRATGSSRREVAHASLPRRNRGINPIY